MEQKLLLEKIIKLCLIKRENMKFWQPIKVECLPYPSPEMKCMLRTPSDSLG